MTQPRSQWLLKVIAGPHQGAEIDLSSGKTLIGSDDGCDVVLHDVLVAPQHLAIETAAKSLQVEPLGGRVYLKGRRVRDPRQKVDPFTFITIGGTHLVIGPAEGKWPLLSAADAPDLEKEAPEPEASEEGSEAAAPAASSGSPAATAVAAAPAQAKRRMSAKAGIILGLVILGVWLGLLWYYGGLPDHKPSDYAENSEDKGAATPEELLKRAQKVLDEAGVADTVKLETVDSRIFANGYVKDTAKQREVEIGFRNHARGVIPKIWSLEQITASARDRLKNKDLEFDVQAKGEGVLTVIGVGNERTLSVWEQVRKELVRDIPGVKKVEDLVKSAALIAAQPVPAPAPAPAPAVPEPSPPPSAPTPAPTVKNDVPRPLFRTVDTPEATITEISARKGGLPFFRLSSGGAYYNGSKLPYGGIVTSITDKAVVIREDERDRVVAVGQKVRRDPVPDLPEPDAGASANSSTAKP